jgi:hypothetical protein
LFEVVLGGVYVDDGMVEVALGVDVDGIDTI